MNPFSLNSIETFGLGRSKYFLSYHMMNHDASDKVYSYRAIIDC